MTTSVSDRSGLDRPLTAEERLKRLVVDVLLIDDEAFQDANGPGEIETWDSLANVTLAAAVEKEFGVRVPSDDMAAFTCLGDIRRFCRSRGIDV